MATGGSIWKIYIKLLTRKWGGICFDLDLEFNQAPKDLFAFISMVCPLAHCILIRRSKEKAFGHQESGCWLGSLPFYIKETEAQRG